jgi:hypothetical protein
VFILLAALICRLTRCITETNTTSEDLFALKARHINICLTLLKQTCYPMSWKTDIHKELLLDIK